MDNKDIAKTPNIQLTPAEAFVADEIQSFCEMYEPFESDFHKELKNLVLKISNVLDSTVPLVYEDAFEAVSKTNMERLFEPKEV